MEQNQFNPGQFQQPQPQYQPQGFQPQGFQTIPLPRYDVMGLWKSLAALDFKQMALIGVGAWILFWVIGMMASTTIFSLLKDVAAVFIIFLVFSKVAPFLKNNSLIGILLIAGGALFLISDIYTMTLKVDTYEGAMNLLDNLKTIAFLSFAGYGCIAAGMLMTGFSLKHFTLRPVVLLYGIAYAFITLGSLFLFGSSLSAYGTFGIFAVIGGLIILAALIVLLIKVLGSAPIMDPYALPGEPIQQ